LSVLLTTKLGLRCQLCDLR